MVTFGQGNNWKIDGNNNISTGDFLGTTNKKDLRFKTNDYVRMIIDKNEGNFICKICNVELVIDRIYKEKLVVE